MEAGRSKIIVPDSVGVAVNRIRFLTSEPAESDRVRSPILASWRRSRDMKVAADRIELPYFGDPELDTDLTRCAEPVLRSLEQELAGQAVSIVLTDASGMVLSRRTSDSELEHHLDRVQLAPGFSYAERFVGTNGIGTALEVGSATQVFGHEHYAEHLEDLACAGVPIHDPITRRLLGVIDLTCWRKEAHSLLVALARTTAAQIEQSLLTASRLGEFEVLQAYRQTCRRTTGIVFALAKDAVLLNDHARAELGADDQAALLAFAAETGSTLSVGRRRSVELVLPTGPTARLHCQQVGLDADSDPAGLVVHVKLARGAGGSDRVIAEAPLMAMPGLVGQSPSWQRACRQVDEALERNRWLVLEGEPGVGKLAVLRAAQVRRQPPRRYVVIDAKEAADPDWMARMRDALSHSDSVVLAHLGALDARSARSLAAALREVKVERGSALWVAATAGPGAGRVAALRQVLTSFPTTIEVPPLRLRLNDLPALTSFFLGKFGRGGQVTCSSEALRLLMRASWPGNVGQLAELLREVAQRRRSGSIAVHDLPPELHALSRRVLSTLESIERDAIVQSLADANGIRAEAARSLGMSRATIYRKIHEYGIVAPT